MTPSRQREGTTDVTGLPQREPELGYLEPLARLIVLWIRDGSLDSKAKDRSKPSSPPATSTQRPVRLRKKPRW